jgi:hypothetical protein
MNQKLEILMEQIFEFAFFFSSLRAPLGGEHWYEGGKV